MNLIRIQSSTEFIKSCINNGTRGMADLFIHMFLIPMKNKIVKENRNGEIYYHFDGKLYERNEFLGSIVVSYIIENIINALEEFKMIYTGNTSVSPQLLNKDIRDVLRKTDKIISQINDGMFNRIIMFIRPHLRLYL